MPPAPGEDPVIELEMPSFLMPPAERWHAERVPPSAQQAMNWNIKRILFHRRTVRLRAVRNVFVTQEGLVLHPDLTVEHCTIRQHSQADIDIGRKLVRLGQEMGAIMPLQGDVVLCRRPGSGNYGHFLVEMLPIAYTASQHWPRPARFMVQAADPPLAGVMAECLDRLGIPANLRIVAGRTPVLVECLVIVEGLTDHGSYIAPLAMECLDRLSANIPAGTQENLFVTRGAVRTRKLRDEAAIMRRARARGFQCVAPGTLPFAAQVAAFKGARRIVGVMGATLSNLVFAPRGAQAFVLAPANMPDTFFWFICGLRGIRMIDLRCAGAPGQQDDTGWDGEVILDPADEAAVFASPDRAGAPDIAGLFNAAYYAAACGAALPPDADPLEHYCETGWRDGFDPSARFSTMGYLAANPDVVRSGSNPLLHYIEHGMAEGRAPRP